MEEIEMTPEQEARLEKNAQKLLENTFDAIDTMFVGFEPITKDNERTIITSLGAFVMAIIIERYGPERLEEIVDRAKKNYEDRNELVIEVINSIFAEIEYAEEGDTNEVS